ncbi:class I adenylate-forming enzyme family protein [Temperatibacter marinus]|uniref:Class I adenylate-forming enzyme family protein n=1 Tax=Temperatibacter marinus TaxID=1456591 RepID=A0AA52EG18_9PROT|nr:class I adenylate-forming enzyme family protein [Temperatibacter marinus]WND03013.1 class I adenylate-forming enzyme family protein [Temperatibacter marinus]
MSAEQIYNAQFLKTIQTLTSEGQPLEIEEMEIKGISYPVFRQMPSFLRDIYEAAYEHNDRDFMVYGQERLSYRQALDKAKQLAWALRQDYKIKTGDRIAIACRNYPEWCITYLAVTSIGAIIVPLNSWWKTEELEYAVRDSDPSLIFLDSERAEYLSPYMDSSGLSGVIIRGKADDFPGAVEWDDLLKYRPADTWPSCNSSIDDPATLFYTSGSTGSPKGVLSSARAVMTCLMTWAMMGVANKLVDGKSLEDKDTHLGTLVSLPLFHITGCNSLFLLSLLQGRKIVFIDKWDVTHAMQLIEEEKLTHFVGVPTMTYELLNTPNRDEFNLSSLEDIGGGGAARPADHVQRLKDSFGVDNVGIGYGMTETNALGTLIGKDNYLRRPASVGQANTPIVEIKIVDDHDMSLSVNQPGEICIKSASNMQAYWNNQKATDATLKDGWLYTGDIGYLDEDGFLFISDRKKELIISGGENISPFEIETAILKVDGVLDVCVFSLPDERMGEVVGALVRVSKLIHSADAILSALDLKIAHFKLPKSIYIQTDPLPVLGTGKADKKTIQHNCRSLYLKEKISC